MGARNAEQPGWATWYQPSNICSAGFLVAAKTQLSFNRSRCEYRFRAWLACRVFRKVKANG
jgi:hypothetical protein